MIGQPFSPEVAADVLACQQVAHAFCELLDAGDLDAAFALHHDDVAFYGPDGSGPLDRAGAREDAVGVRFAYPDRRTLHVITNFIAEPHADGTIHAHYQMTVYELTEHIEGVTSQRRPPVIFVLAEERAIFRRDGEGPYRYAEQRLILVAPKRDLR